jgi:hypothetical protein
MSRLLSSLQHLRDAIIIDHVHSKHFLTSIIRTFHSFLRGQYIFWCPLLLSLLNKICSHISHISWKPPFAEACDHLLISRKHTALLNQCISSTLLLLETALITYFKFVMMWLVFLGMLDNSRISYLHVHKLILYRTFLFCHVCVYFQINLTYYRWSFVLIVLKWWLDASWPMLKGSCVVFMWLPRVREEQNAAQFSVRCAVCLRDVHVLVFNLI